MWRIICNVKAALKTENPHTKYGEHMLMVLCNFKINAKIARRISTNHKPQHKGTQIGRNKIKGIWIELREVVAGPDHNNNECIYFL